MSRRPCERVRRVRDQRSHRTLRPPIRAILLGCAAALAAPACSDPEPGPIERPNVVVVMIDTLRADKLSSYGHPCDPSPALTRLAENGVQFDSVLSQTSWTLPSVGSMLTSRYPRSLGLYDERSVLTDEHVTLAELLKGGGYTTLGATANPNLNLRAGIGQGFDTYVDSLVIFAQDPADVPEGHVHYQKGKGTPLHTAPEIFDTALRMVDAAPDGFPYYLQLNVMEVHEHQYRSMLRPEYEQGFDDCSDKSYLRKVRQVTDDLALFVDELRARPGWEDTLFVVTSDHGEGLRDHPDVPESRGHGALLYDSQVRVPWIMWNDDWTPGRRRVEQDVRLLDFLPTILDYVGVRPPPDVEGISLMPVVGAAVERAPLPEVFVTETTFRDYWKLSVRSADWQYVHNRDGHDGVREHELQPRDGTPNGALTDRGHAHAAELDRLRRFLADWERSHEPAAPTRTDLTEAEREQLEQIGYLR